MSTRPARARRRRPPPRPATPRFRDQMVALHRAIYKRNQQRIHDAVEGDSREFDAYEARYHRSLPAPRGAVSFAELLRRFARADVILLGDYHTLEQAQRSMLRVLRQVCPPTRPLALAVEFVEGRHQAALDAFGRGALAEATFLRRIAYHQHWPYGSFDGPRAICELARAHALPMLAIDQDAARGATLAARDAYAARRIVDWVEAEPGRQVFCLIGELHLAPAHLPAAIQRAARRPLRVLSLHQNAERVYHALEAQGLEQDVEIVELNRDRLALNVVPPVVCQQSFLRWLDEDDQYYEVEHLREAFRDQVQLIAGLLELDASEALATVKIETFRDLTFVGRLASSGAFRRGELDALRTQILNSESYFIPRSRLVYLGTPSVNHSSEEAAHLLRHVLAGDNQPRHAIEAFYDRAVNEALAFFCSKLINHRRKALHESSYQRMLRVRRRGKQAPYSPFELEVARRVVAHRRLERGVRSVDTEGLFVGSSQLLDALAHALGYMLGDRLYYAVVRDELDRSVVRQVLLDPLTGRGAAVAAYFSLASRVAGVRVPRRV